MIECDEDDEYLTLEVEGFRNKDDKPTEYSIKYTCMDNDNTGTINNINTLLFQIYYVMENVIALLQQCSQLKNLNT